MRRRQELFEDTEAVNPRLQEQMQLLETDYAQRMRQQQLPPSTTTTNSASTAQRLVQQLERLEALQRQQPKLDITANW